MLTITIQGEELWDEEAEVFRYTEGAKLQFEHSLVSLSKWEAKFHKRFLTPEAKTNDEMLGYIRAMLITSDVDDSVLHHLDVEQVEAIDAYINDPMTGSVINELPTGQGRQTEQISSELIYFWMSQYQIAISCEEWHLNRLFTLIKIHHAKSQKPKRMPRHTRAQQMAEVNAARKAKLGTTG